MKTIGIGKPTVLAKIALYGLLLLSVYYSTFTWLVTHDWVRGDYSYCYLIPFIVLYLIWDKRSRLLELFSVPSWKGIYILVPGIFLFWLGELSGEFFTLYISFWLVLVGLCWLHLGWQKLKIIFFPLALTLTMFPPPNFIYRKISVNLKLVSSQLGVATMQLFGMSAYREGNVIDLGFTQLQVVDACSGLRYLFPLIVLGILLAYFYKAAFWKKAVLVISTVPISIVVNGLRIALVGMLYPVFGPKVAEGFFHDFSGWFIFMVSLGILLAEMWILKKILPEKSSLVQGSKRQEAGRLEGWESEKQASTQNSKFKIQNLFFSPQFVVAVILLGATLALSQGVEFREKIPIAKSFDEFPVQIGEWSGTRQSMEQKFVDELDLSDYVTMDYQNKQGKSVNFYVAYYESQRKGESIHSPATCLRGGGWIFNQAGAVTIPVTAYGSSFMNVNRAFMQKGAYKQLSYYWFPHRGRILTNAYQLKIFAFWDALTKQRTDGALVRVITPVYESETLKYAEARLQEFTKEIVPVLAGYIPGKQIK